MYYTGYPLMLLDAFINNVNEKINTVLTNFPANFHYNSVGEMPLLQLPIDLVGTRGLCHYNCLTS